MIYRKPLFNLFVYFFGLWTLFLLLSLACDKPNHLSEDKQSDSEKNMFLQYSQNKKQLEQELDWITYFWMKKKDRQFQLIIENLKSAKTTIFSPINNTNKKKANKKRSYIQWIESTFWNYLKTQNLKFNMDDLSHNIPSAEGHVLCSSSYRFKESSAIMDLSSWFYGNSFYEKRTNMYDWIQLAKLKSSDQYIYQFFNLDTKSSFIIGIIKNGTKIKAEHLDDKHKVFQLFHPLNVYAYYGCYPKHDCVQSDAQESKLNQRIIFSSLAPDGQASLISGKDYAKHINDEEMPTKSSFFVNNNKKKKSKSKLLTKDELSPVKFNLYFEAHKSEKELDYNIKNEFNYRLIKFMEKHKNMVK